MQKRDKIIGLDKYKYPKLFNSILIVLEIYNLPSINISKPLLPSYNYIKAGSLFGDSIIMSIDVLDFLENLNPDETSSIIAHELSHVYNRDDLIYYTYAILSSLSIGIFLSTIIFNINIGLFNQMLSFILIFFFLRLLTYASRKAEARCDQDIVLKIKKPEAYKSGLLKYYLRSNNKKRLSLINYLRRVLRNFTLFIIGEAHPDINKRINSIDILSMIIKA